jgi:hypothetical protein
LNKDDDNELKKEFEGRSKEEIGNLKDYHDSIRMSSCFEKMKI